MTKILLVALGGALGSSARYLLSGWIQQGYGVGFPMGTLTVNLVGCLLIGFLAPLLTGPWLVRDEYRVFILIGILGGFTTFSSYAWETLSLAGGSQFAAAGMNLLLSNAVGLLAAWSGSRVAIVLYGR